MKKKKKNFFNSLILIYRIFIRTAGVVTKLNVHLFQFPYVPQKKSFNFVNASSSDDISYVSACNALEIICAFNKAF